MPRQYTRKTTWGKTHLEEMESAAAEVKEGKKSIRAAARDRNINKSSLLRFKDCFMIGAPPGAKGTSTRTGWMNEDTWAEFLDHLIQHTNCTPDRPMLLILDNLKAHISLKAVEIAKSNGIVLLTLPHIPSHAASRRDRVWPVQDPIQPSS